MNDTTSTDANPFAGTIEEGFAATRNGSKDYSKFLKSYRSVNNSPFLFSSDVKASLRVLMLAHFEVFPPSMNEAAEAVMWERSEDAEYFAGLIEKETKNLLIAARDHLGTHTAKVPNPGVTGPGGLFADADVFAAAAGLAFVSSATFSARQRLGAAGNAAQGKAQRFLASRIKIGDQVFDVSESIASKGVIFDAMHELGFAADAIEELSEILSGRIDGTIGDTTPGQGAKGLIWPTADGDVVITPVHSYAMHVELAARIKERTSPLRRIERTHVIVGGTKPQNAGLVNSDMGGWHRMLVSRPPEVASVEDRAAERVARTGKIDLATIRRDAEVARKLSYLIRAHWKQNDSSRREMDAATASLVRIALHPWVDLAEGYDEGLRGERFFRLDPLLTELFSVGFDRMPRSTEVVDRIVAHVVEAADIGADLDDALRRRIVLVTEPILSKAFKGK
jgi:hypothetical protein